jgi:anti-sigma factor RsiW
MDHPPLNPMPETRDLAPGAPAGTPITEADLHAYADGLLGATRRAEIEAFLAGHPAERERVADWAAQNLALRRLLDPVIHEPLPLQLPLTAPTRRTDPWRALAAGVAIAVASAGSAWWLRGLTDANDGRLMASAGTLHGFAHRAAVAHAVYSPDARRPVEVGGEQEQALVTWLTKRMGTAVKPPDLRGLGYDLIGGRLLPGDKGPVAQFMFGDAKGQRLTLYVTREDAGRNAAFRFGQDGGVNVFYWVDKDFGYALSAGTDRQTLLRVAEAVYQQLSPKP